MLEFPNGPSSVRRRFRRDNELLSANVIKALSALHKALYSGNTSVRIKDETGR